MGRFARSWELTKQSYRVLMQDKELMVLPILSGLTILLICGTFVAGFAISGQDLEQIDETQGVLAGLAFYIVSYTVAFYFQAALIAGALERMNGGDPTLGSALGAASRRFGAILLWGVIAGTVGAILKAIQERSEIVGKIVASLMGVAWSLATFFMVPILVMEEASVADSFKRSTRLFRQTWGETLVGSAGVGLASMLVAIPIALVAVALGTAIDPWAGIAFGVPAIALSMVFFSALQNVYVAALYRYATTGETVDGFDQALVAGAFDNARTGKRRRR